MSSHPHITKYKPTQSWRSQGTHA